MQLPRLTALSALLGGAVFAFAGAVSATHGDFGGTHNTIDSTSEYLVTAGFGLGLLLIAPVYAALRRITGSRAGLVAVVPLVVLGVMSLASVAMGEDAAFFNAVAPLCLLTWLAASIVLARALRRAGAPLAVAIAPPLLVPVTVVLAPVGGQLITGAAFLAVGIRTLRGAALRPAVA